MEKQTKRWVIAGALAGFVAGSIYAASNEKTRNCVKTAVTRTSSKTKHWVQVINDNREAVTEQIQASGEKISTIVNAASDDIQKLMETSRTLKQHASELLGAVQESTGELKELKNKLQEEDSLEEELLPESEEQKKLSE